MTTIDNMFELAIELRNKGSLQDAINILYKILNDYPLNERSYGVLSVLGGYMLT
jgi:hypothetical protein